MVRAVEVNGAGGCETGGNTSLSGGRWSGCGIRCVEEMPNCLGSCCYKVCRFGVRWWASGRYDYGFLERARGAMMMVRLWFVVRIG